MRISDWSSDVCSSDLAKPVSLAHKPRKSIDIVPFERAADPYLGRGGIGDHDRLFIVAVELGRGLGKCRLVEGEDAVAPRHGLRDLVAERSEEHTSELQSLMRISYAVFCLKKKKTQIHRY